MNTGFITAGAQSHARQPPSWRNEKRSADNREIHPGRRRRLLQADRRHRLQAGRGHLSPNLTITPTDSQLSLASFRCWATVSRETTQIRAMHYSRACSGALGANFTEASNQDRIFVSEVGAGSQASPIPWVQWRCLVGRGGGVDL
jgi:hypothetical protein